MKKTIVLIIALFVTGVAMAKVKLPSVLADGMVLQQQTEVKLWGKAETGKNVAVTTSWDSSTYKTTVDNNGHWNIKVKTPKATAIPQTINIAECGKTNKKGDITNTVILQNILIGEVWLCSGQSNMEMPMRGFDRQPLTCTNDIIARAKASTPVRMFITDSERGEWIRQYSKTPQDDCRGSWFDNTPDNVASTSAVAYMYARYLNDVLEIPVGIIITTLGGSRIEPWMSREAISGFGRDLSFLDTDTEVKNIHADPCVLYNAKIHPFTTFPIRGILWYQGESNRDNADEYGQMMESFVSDLRTQWAKGTDRKDGGIDIPFYYVEIAPFNYEGADGTSAARMREVQASCMKTIPNSGMVSTIDVGHPRFIHPTDKQTVANRLAWLALARTYKHTGFGYASPVYRSMEIADNKIYINVDNAERGLCPMWTELKGFEIAGSDGVFHPAFAEIEEKTCRLAVSCNDVPHPKAVRYAYKNTPEISVYNIYGLPLLPFRTDK